jgi:hypothetical protein
MVCGSDPKARAAQFAPRRTASPPAGCKERFDAESLAVFSEAELKSRCEITLGNYSKAVIIEANTCGYGQKRNPAVHERLHAAC